MTIEVLKYGSKADKKHCPHKVTCIKCESELKFIPAQHETYAGYYPVGQNWRTTQGVWGYGLTCPVCDTAFLSEGISEKLPL